MNHLGERLTALVDGELSHTERDRAFAHLAVCGDCRADAVALRRLKRRVHGLSEPSPPPDLMSALFSLSEPGEPLPPRPPRTLPQAGGFGSTADAFSADGIPGQSLPPAAAAAAFLGLTGERPLGERAPLGSRGFGGDDFAPSGGRRLSPRALVLGAVSIAALAMGTAFFVGGNNDDTGPVVTPQEHGFAVEHTLTTGDLVVTHTAVNHSNPAVPSGAAEPATRRHPAP